MFLVAGHCYQPVYHQLRLATQEEPLDEEESRDEELQYASKDVQESRLIKINDIQGSPLSAGGGAMKQSHLCKKQLIVKLEEGLPDLKICIEDETLTCGWLIGEVTRRYAYLIDQHKHEGQRIVHHGEQPPHIKIKKKIIAAIKSSSQNESLDFWLTLYNRSLNALWDGLQKKDSGLLFAMKVMEKSFVMNDGKFRQVMCERQIMETLNHPFIVKLHWAFQSSQELNFVMDLCAGGELFYLLHQRGRMQERQAKFYFAEILLGLEFIHSKGIVYRDLKPENVLLDIDGHIKLADFGLSKYLPSLMSLTNSFCGSPEYMSPEMLNGQGHGFAVDYYSLGAILFEMLTGLPPFYSTDRMQMYQDIVDSNLSYPDYLNLQVVDLLKKLLCKDQAQRLSFNSINKIKTHPWCKDIDWPGMLEKRIEPPWLPDITKSNFDPDYTSLPLDLTDLNSSPEYTQTKINARRQIQRSVYCCIDNSAMTSFYDSTTIAENSGFLQNHHSGYHENITQNNQLNIYSSRSKLLEFSANKSALMKSPRSKEVEKALDQMFRGFSFYSEPVEEKEVQRQIREYQKIKEQLKKKNQLQVSKIKPQNYEEMKQQARGELPPKAQRQINHNSNIILANMRGATQAIQQNAQSIMQKSNSKNQIVLRRHDQSSIIDEEISIAQEFSRVDEDSDLDEQPGQKDSKINKIKINNTTENSITRANDLNSRIFDSYTQGTLSPSGIMTMQQTAVKAYFNNNRANTKSSDSTPFNNQRKYNGTENNSLISQVCQNPDNNSLKKPKFLQKFTSYLTKDDPQKKNLMKDFSPIQSKNTASVIQNNINNYSTNSQFSSPSKVKQSDRNTFISENSYQGSIVNAQIINQTISGGFSRNNSGNIITSMSNNNQTTNQRTSMISVADSIQNSLMFSNTQQQDTINSTGPQSAGPQSMLMTQSKSRNGSSNLGSASSHNTIHGVPNCLKSQEHIHNSTKAQSLYQRQKQNQNLNLTPFSIIETSSNNNSSSNKGLVQQSFCQKPPRQQNQSIQQINGTLSRQQSINYSNQSTNMQTSLTAYQRSKATLSNIKGATMHSSLQRKQSGLNETQISGQLIVPQNLTNNQSSQSLGPKKNLKILSSTNVLSHMSDKLSNITPKYQNHQDSSSTSCKRKQQIQNTAVSSSSYQSIVEMSGKQVLQELNNFNPLGTFKQAHRTFSKESENRAPLQSTNNLSDAKPSQNNLNLMYYKRNESQSKKRLDNTRVKGGQQPQNENLLQYNAASQSKGRGYLTLK
ncbi:UNKNOWN [Stylonychia lemnae]|uniref:Protein kinase domain containing protein n=1 Tax=Stylonychia lemnae TaxID=5949 RepID=A0A078AQE6_STYLE|nr:UNKNOWN [Stylonychia lemnae]|eukprot:CDW83472.1 UNKNOWN [Stylonychia lemnae]